MIFERSPCISQNGLRRAVNLNILLSFCTSFYLRKRTFERVESPLQGQTFRRETKHAPRRFSSGYCKRAGSLAGDSRYFLSGSDSTDALAQKFRASRVRSIRTDVTLPRVAGGELASSLLARLQLRTSERRSAILIRESFID